MSFILSLCFYLVGVLKIIFVAQFVLEIAKLLNQCTLGATLNYDLSMSVILIRSMCGHECLVLKNVLCFVMGYLVAMETYITLF